jgi:glycosyltransferase involved in cell wall biosynthesis
MTFAHRWLDGLLAAAGRLRERYPELTLLLLGGREAERAALADQARALGFAVGDGAPNVAGRATVQLVPARPQAEVLRFLAAADALAIPDTVTDVTASPLKLFEYMALGQPLVLPAIPALHEIVPPALCHPFARRSLDGLTQALGNALAAAPDRGGAAARRALAAEHTYGRRAERILDVVARVARP